MGRTYVSRDIQDQDLMDINLLTANQQFLNDSLNNECGDESSVISSLSDVSSVSKRSKWLGAKHGRNNCLHCSRARRNRTHTQRLDSDAAAASAVLPAGGELYTSSGTLVGATTTTHVARKTTKQPPVAQQLPSIQQATKSQPPQQNAQSSSTIQLSDISFNSPESILSEESMPDRLTANILFNVQRLANPVSARLTKKALLELKQKHPAAFQDICLYSEVCKTLGRSSYRMNARRFLQELFLDLNFDSFYAEPSDILLKKDMDFERDRSEVERLHELSGSSRATKGKSGASAALGATAGAIGGHGGEVSGGTAKVLTTQTIAGLSYMPTHKAVAHLSGKLQPLASVYEASCENLLQDGTTKSELNVKTKLKGDNNHEDKMDARAKVKTLGNTSTSMSATSSLGRAMRNELRITSDSDESDYEDTNRSTQWIAAPSVLTNDDVDEVDGIAIQRCSITPASSRTAAFSCTTTGTNTASSQPTISSSNCSSEQTTNSSNRSSICTISRQPAMARGFSDNNMEHINISSNSNININNNNNNANANVNTSSSSTNLNANISTSVSSGSVGTSTTGTTGTSICGVSVGGGNNTGGANILENQNKKYTRGRFYTLELDLSCTKNKFPITDRSRNSANWKTESALAAAAPAATAATTSTAANIDGAILRRGSCAQGVGENGGPLTIGSTKLFPNSLTTTNKETRTTTTTTTTTSTSNTNFHYRLPIMRQSYTAGIMPQMQYIHTDDGGKVSTHSSTATTTNSNNSNATDFVGSNVGVIGPSTVKHNVTSSNQPTSTTTSVNTLTITKSLAASLAKPIGSLYCEKRLQALKLDTKATDT